MGFLCYQCDGTGKNYRDPNCVLAVLTTLVIVSSIEFTSYALFDKCHDIVDKKMCHHIVDFVL